MNRVLAGSLSGLAATGALYGAVCPASLKGGASVLAGTAYGLAIWAGSYLGWFPALKILPSATRDSLGRNTLMIAAHFVWGSALGALCGRRVS